MGNGPIGWVSSQQEVVALSSTESEYIALCSAGKESMWFRRLLAGFQIPEEIVHEPMTMMTDNQGSMQIARKGCSSRRTKHIDLRFHCNRELVENKTVDLEYFPSEIMIADMLTKPLGRLKMQSLRSACGMKLVQAFEASDREGMLAVKSTTLM